MTLSPARIVEKTADRVREFIANGNNPSTYIGQPVPISYRDSDRVTDETLTALVGKSVKITDNYSLRIFRATLADKLSRSQILVHLANS